ncbi:hypothetical protein A0H76_1452 [Hepatospora eriocheir]|uniref:Uncharacterized protein n=1 Tax=Hepatospora eriocheir TaxID=1081669 RepID=A0A1X0QH02_9MICR|nr:hypothetical protein A0H76_1452 [Hepatospora eriocheir]
MKLVNLSFISSKLVIDFTVAIEKFKNDEGLTYFIGDTIQKYNSRLKDGGVEFRLNKVLFYDELQTLEPTLYSCVGKDDINCRKKILKDNPTNILYFVSTNNIDNDFSKYMIINPCRSRYFGNVFGNNSLYNEISLSLKDWISNLLGTEINLNSDSKIFASSKLLKEFKRCKIIYEISEDEEESTYKNYTISTRPENINNQKNNIESNLDKSDVKFPKRKSNYFFDSINIKEPNPLILNRKKVRKFPF